MNFIDTYRLDLSAFTTKRICCFGSASDGVPAYSYGVETEDLTYRLGMAGCDVILGLGTTGYMGHALAGAARAGAHIIGVIPDFIVPKEKRPRQRQTDNSGSALWKEVDYGIVLRGEDKRLLLQTRQRIMIENSDGILVMIGGDVTFAELFESLAWQKYKLMAKQVPIVLYSPNGQWGALEAMRREAKKLGFNTSYSSRLGGKTGAAPYIRAHTPQQVFRAFGLSMTQQVKRSHAPKNKQWDVIEVHAPLLELRSGYSDARACTRSLMDLPQHPLSVVVASGSPIKLEAARKAFRKLNLDVKIVNVEAPSGVNEQPMELMETQRGAENRINYAIKKKPGADIYLSMENGVFKTESGYEDRAIVICETAHGRTQAFSEALALPPQFVREAEKRGFATTTVGQILFDREIIADYKDPHHGLTGRPRKDYLANATEQLLESELLASALTVRPKNKIVSVGKPELIV